MKLIFAIFVIAFSIVVVGVLTTFPSHSQDDCYGAPVVGPHTTVIHRDESGDIFTTSEIYDE